MKKSGIVLIGVSSGLVGAFIGFKICEGLVILAFKNEVYVRTKLIPKLESLYPGVTKGDINK